MADVDRVREKFAVLRWVMDERVTRLWAAAEARALGRGGAAIVTAATGIREKRILLGMRDLDDVSACPPTEKPQHQRIRRPGGGRKPLTEKDPTLSHDLEALVDPVTRGDPESPLRWTTKSKAKLAEELMARGHQVSATKVGRLLHDMGYSLQATSKTTEGAQSPDRDAQFEHINAEAKRFLKLGQPIVSVDTKKKELIGDFKNAGREWQPKGDPVKVNTYDFPKPEVGKGIPYGVLDLGNNVGWVSVGIDHDTAAFAVQTIRTWWVQMGQETCPEAKELLITADGGGSNGSRNRLWKVQLQKLADEFNLKITVCHFPPGTSKWNKIEHQMFNHISMNWRGRPLTSHEVMVNLIGATTTQEGLRIEAKVDRGNYPTGIKVPNKEMEALKLQRADFHGNWNYTISPRSET